MRSQTLQRILASIFLVLGAWCMFLPRMVEQLTIRPEHQVLTAASSVFIACFGAQAVLCGGIIWFSKFTPKTFLAFGLLGSIPFFAFNWYFYFVQPIFTRWMLLDFAGNVVILLCGLIGYRISHREHPLG
ncbi:hypothetical protein [Noviluteimonas gilva]|uniref:Uncharacterized protein n=1 Tax=Noviluteimonas gilva TaxID=2682097 RepID=A0A7C9HNH0_9GAMM|nr:hypothetical protein [Lysobacter gilvus]MUV15217.1 hypothetical protein [Lysobacter gilvus]